MSARRSLLERLALWAASLRSDPAVASVWVDTAVREDGTAASAPPLAVVHHQGADTPDTIARALAGAIVACVDVEESKGATVRLYPLTREGDPLRQGYRVRVDEDLARPVLATSAPEVARLPESDRIALLRDTAYASVIGAQRGHTELLHTHLAASLEHSHTMVGAVVSSLQATQAFAHGAITAADARARAAEERERAAMARVDELTARCERLERALNEAMDAVEDHEASSERWEKFMGVMTPVLQGMGVRFRHATRPAASAPPVNGTPREDA